MSRIRQNSKNVSFWVAALFFIVVVYLLFPLYQYNVDPDGTSYLRIAQRYASGDYATAINGLWSPWACWLTALLINCGLPPIPASIVINSIGGVGFLYISDSIFRKFKFSVYVIWFFNISLAFFLVFAVFWQTFNDLWQAFLLLTILRVMMSNDYPKQPMLWVATGVLATIAYYSKAYSLPFFILNTFCCSWIISGGNKVLWVKMVLIPISILIVGALPWVYALHAKYGIWGASTAGPLNMAWYLVGHPYWKEGIDILVPPVYADSPYYWEDPYLVNGIMPKFTDSWFLFGKQLLRVGYNCIMMVYSMCEITLFMPFVGIYMLRSFILRSRFSGLPAPTKLVYLSFMLLPLGYIMVHFESRYMWYMLPLAMVAMVFLIEDIARKYGWGKTNLILLFSVSIVLFPIWQLIKTANLGKAEYEYAQRLKQKFRNSIDVVSNMHPRHLSKIAYFSGIRFFVINRQVLPANVEDTNALKSRNTRDLVEDVGKNNVPFYMYAKPGSKWLKNPGFDNLFFENMNDSSGAMGMGIKYEDVLSGITIYELGY